VGHPKPVILARAVYNLINLVLVVLLLLAASAFLGVADEH
jgi:Na+-transporting NADH:ubiquinone oxidoreductase subunit NqrF